MAGHHYVTNFACEENGTWALGTRNNELSLFYIKTQGTRDNKVEVHVSSRSSGYTDRVWEHATSFTCENNGVWAIGPTWSNNWDVLPNLYYLKTRGTTHNKVEVHIATGTSAYTDLLHHETPYDCEESGSWVIDPNTGNLAYIKVNGTPGNTELHMSPANDYNTRTDERATVFPVNTQGIWGITTDSTADPTTTPLVTLIQPTGTPSGFVRTQIEPPHIGAASGGNTNLPCEDNGVWCLMFPYFSPILTYIKIRNTESHMVEVHIWD